MTSYVALLRGINVGGNKKVPMADLKKTLEALGFTDVKTLLASGNVIFTAPTMKPKVLTEKLEAALEKKFKFSIPVLIRTVDEIQKLIDSDPFKKITVTDNTRLYITFLSEKHESKLKVPYVSPDKDFFIVKLTDDAVISYLELSPTSRSVDSMAFIEKEFGKKVTTRNWNTVLKPVK